jgi:hypothetical protein
MNPMASKTRRSIAQAARRPGKEASGWEKLGIYLSLEAAQRLMMASMKRGKDRSTILDGLVLRQLPPYEITVSTGSVVPTDRLDPELSVAVEISAA